MGIGSDGVGVTYRHLLEVLDGRLPPGDAPIKMLDAGCGMGDFMLLAHEALTVERPALEVHGFDVVGHGVQVEGFLTTAVGRLETSYPEVDWGKRVRQASREGPWPYSDSAFDVVITNQVFEHVSDVGGFLSELKRVLVPGGFSLHLFPLAHVLQEWHLGLPLVHKIQSHALRKWYVERWSRLGVGAYDQSIAVEAFSQAHSDYIAAWTHYTTWRRFCATVHGLGLRVDNGLTYDLYARRLREGRWSRIQMPRLGASTDDHPILRTLFFHVAKFVSIVCLEISHANSYDAAWFRGNNGGRILSGYSRYGGRKCGSGRAAR